MDLTQLQKLGISLPPEKAFSVELSPHEREIIAFWLMSQIATGRSARAVKTVNAAVTAVAANIINSADAPRMVVIQNNSATLNVWIAINSTASQTLGVQIPPGGYWESPFDFCEPVSAISTGNVTLTLITSVR